MPEDLKQYLPAVFAVFGRSGTLEADPFLVQAPSYVPELDLMVMSDQNEVAAFCTVWVDPVNHYAEFEPVGTVPEFSETRSGFGVASRSVQSLASAGLSAGDRSIMEYLGRRQQVVSGGGVTAQRQSTQLVQINRPSGFPKS